jgi:hypothetical protein
LHPQPAPHVMRFILDVVAEVGSVHRAQLPVHIVLDPGLAQDMHLPLPNSDLKHLVGQNNDRLTAFEP